MTEIRTTVSAQSPTLSERQPILAERWPTLSAAMRQYETNQAESFTQIAYDAVEQGLIRLDERDRLSRVAEGMGIRDFDAQLLIACAIRKWHFDRREDGKPSKHAPRLSYEYKAWVQGWRRFAIVVAVAIAVDAFVLYHWLHS
jgi:hypothetical protein